MRRQLPCLVIAVALAAGSTPARAQDNDPRAVIIVSGGEPTSLIRGSMDQDIADQLFLRLAVPNALLVTTGDAFVPQLAKSWKRRDPLTVAFALDPLARWHDGTPVTARDVIFTWERLRNPKVAPQLATLLSAVTSITAEDDGHTAVIHFARSYAEQFYDVTFNLQLLPAHLLDKLPPEQLASDPFVRAPVGNGPFRWKRAVPGQFTELDAVPDFFLGPVGPSRLIYRLATDSDTRMNLLLTGGADALETVPPPLSNDERLTATGRLRVVPIPGPLLMTFNFNQRDRADHNKPHRLFSDPVVRRALVLALDRVAINQSVWGNFSKVPVGPASQIVGNVEPGAKAAGQDVKKARALLASRGWKDTDGDGILDKDGQPLSFALLVPNTSAPRRLIAQSAQQQWQQAGIKAEITILDFPTLMDRRKRGDFDAEVGGTNQDPTPSGLVQSWSCAGVGGSNVISYCNPKVDSLLAAAAAPGADARKLWREVLHLIDDDTPAAFMAAPAQRVVVPRRFDNVTLTPWSVWAQLWRWRPAAAAGAGAAR